MPRTESDCRFGLPEKASRNWACCLPRSKTAVLQGAREPRRNSQCAVTYSLVSKGGCVPMTARSLAHSEPQNIKLREARDGWERRVVSIVVVRAWDGSRRIRMRHLPPTIVAERAPNEI